MEINDGAAVEEPAPPPSKLQQVLGCGCLTILLVGAVLVAVHFFNGGKKPQDVRQPFANSFRAFSRLTGPCDDGMQNAGHALTNLTKDGNLVDTYAVVKAGASACRAAIQSIHDFDFPAGLPDSIDVEKIRSACSDAYGSEQAALASELEVLDGDDKPSKQVDMREALEAAPALKAECVAQWATAAQKLHVTLPTT